MVINEVENKFRLGLLMDSNLIDICYKKYNKEVNLSWDELAKKYNYKNGELLRCAFKKYRKSIGDLKSHNIVRDV